MAICAAIAICATCRAGAPPRRAIDSRHPLWMVHVDVWNKADPQKIIDLVPESIRPYVCMNLSLSCQYDPVLDVYKMPQNAIRTYKSWASICQLNNMWFTCQPASGGHTHIRDDDLETFEYFFRRYPNFLGWNYCEQFWGFGTPNDKSSSSIAQRVELFAKLVRMSAHYGGFLTVSYCGGSHPLSPLGMLKSHKGLLKACKENPEAILWLYKYTTTAHFHNNESVIFGPFVAGLAQNYGVRYDNCGWNGTMAALLGESHGNKYPTAAGLATVLEQTCVNGGAVWDGPELIWTEDFQNLPNTYDDGFTRRNWGTYPGFRNGWLDMFAKIVEGGFYIPTRDEILERTKIAIVNDISEGGEEERYGASPDLYDGLYLLDDPFNPNGGHWENNHCYLKKTGRYAAIPVMPALLADAAKAIAAKVRSSEKERRWPNLAVKIKEFDSLYPPVSKGDLYVSRHRNQLVVYMPYSILNEKKTAKGEFPLLYSTCSKMAMSLGSMSCGVVREYPDRIDVYLNNYGVPGEDIVGVVGAKEKPSYKLVKRAEATATVKEKWDFSRGTYMLRISHDGPVDLKISCAGKKKPSRRDVLPEKLLAADPPAKPPAFSGEVVVEAEDMDRRRTGDCVLNPYGERPDARGHAGNGFVEMGTDRTGALRHTLKLGRDGDYVMSVRYMNGGEAGNMSAEVNGTAAPVPVAHTEPNGWRRAKVGVKMRKGENVIVLSNPKGIAATIDQISYTPAGMAPEKFRVSVRKTEHGTASADKTFAPEGAKVSVTVAPEKGCEFVGWDVIHGGVTPGPDGSFIMPDDNVTLRPLFQDRTLVYALDFKRVLAGTIPPGWRTTDGGGTIHEYPEAFVMGARSFTSFYGKWRAALYWREGSAQYGAQSDHQLELDQGRYKLTFACAAWKGSPKYRVRVVGENGSDALESEIYDAAPDVNGDHLAEIDGVKEHEAIFSVARKGRYRIVFESASQGRGEFLLLKANVNKLR